MPKKPFLSHILCLILLVSCSARETIIPLVDPAPLAGTELELVVPISSIDVPNVTDEVNSVSLIGPIFSNIATSLADMTLHEDDGMEVPVDPMVFEFPMLEDADTSALQELTVKAVKLSAYANNEEISLHFFRRIEIYLEAKEKTLGHEDITEEESMPYMASTSEDGADQKLVKGQLILSYDRDIHTLRCLTRCLDMQIGQANWKHILEHGRRFVLRTRVVVDSTPSSEMKIGGRVIVGGKIDPGF